MNYVFMPTPFFCHVWASFGTSFFSPMSCFGKPLIFLFYPMSCLPRVARPPFGVMLWQAPDFSFLSDVMPAPCCPSSFRCHALAKKRERSQRQQRLRSVHPIETWSTNRMRRAVDCQNKPIVLLPVMQNLTDNCKD